VDRRHRTLPTLAALAGLSWMGAVLLVAANPKGIDLAGDLAYDRANRVHTLALVLLLGFALATLGTIRDRGLAGDRTARVLLVGATLMLVGNVVSFWGALAVGGPSELFWGGWVGWLTYLPGELLLLGAFVGLARAARWWGTVSGATRVAIGLVGVLLSITTVTWAISPAVTLVPALLAAFALLVAGTAVANAEAAAPLDTAAHLEGRRAADPAR
jgi:hypothetical protein